MATQMLLGTAPNPGELCPLKRTAVITCSRYKPFVQTQSPYPTSDYKGSLLVIPQLSPLITKELSPTSKVLQYNAACKEALLNKGDEYIESKIAGEERIEIKVH